MKKLLFTISAILLICPAFTQESKPPAIIQIEVLNPAKAQAEPLKTDTQAQKTKKNNFDIGVELSRYRYKEPKGGNPVTRKGTMYGLGASYERRTLPSEASGKKALPLFRADLLFMQGKLDYDGYEKSLSTGAIIGKVHTSDIEDFYFDGSLKAGAAFTAGNTWEFVPYIGLGGRYLVDKGDKESSKHYRRNSTYVYIPIGMQAVAALAKNWQISFNAELDWLILGKQKSKLSQVTNLTSDVTNEQSQGYGIRLSAKAQKNYKKTGIFAQPFLRYWHVQQSDEVSRIISSNDVQLYEPKNETLEWGAKIGIVF